MRPNGVRTRVPSIEWRGASDCFPAPRTFVLAPPDRGMVAIRIGNGGLLHSISSHARPSVLPNSIGLYDVLGELRFVRLLSHSLAPDYKVNFCPPYLSGSLVYFGRHMHRFIGSDRAPLGRHPDTHELEYRCCPSLRTYDRADRMELALLRDQALRYCPRAEKQTIGIRSNGASSPTSGAPLSIATSLSVQHPKRDLVTRREQAARARY